MDATGNMEAIGNMDDRGINVHHAAAPAGRVLLCISGAAT